MKLLALVPLAAAAILAFAFLYQLPEPLATVNIIASSTLIQVGQPITLTGIASDADGNFLSNIRLNFTSNGIVIGKAVTNANGTGIISVPENAVGTLTYSAVSGALSSSVVVTVSPVRPPPPPAKAMEAFLRTEVPNSTWITIWTGILRQGDMARVGSSNVALPAQLSPGLIRGQEFTSSDQIVQNAPIVKAAGLDFISFDFEYGPGFGTPADLANPIAAIQKASGAAHSAGLQFEIAVDRKLGMQLGAQVSRYADIVNYQGQGLLDSGNVAGYANYVIPLAQQSKQINPNVKVIAQVSTRGSLALMEKGAGAVINYVDIIAIWPDTQITGWDTMIHNFGVWFRSTYP